MTVLVGVLCQDGVVIGSDGSATFGDGRIRTVEQPAEKTFVVDPDVILAGTGSVGFAQRFHAVLKKVRARAEWKQTDPAAALRNLSAPITSFSGSPAHDFWDHNTIAKVISRQMIEDLMSTHVNPGAFGALVAFPYDDGCHLYEFAIENFQPEFKVPANWFVAMGSGQLIADPFFGLLRRTFFRDQQPRLQEGVFAAAWVLEHAIELNPGGINRPVQIGVLSRGESGFTARMLTEDELEEQKNSVEAAELYLAGYREKLNARGNTDAPPEPPKIG